MIKHTKSSIQVVLLLAPLLSWSATNAWSASVTIGASKDNSIFQSAVNNSAGGAAGIFAGTNGSSSPRRGLIAFDVAGSVPAGAAIASAQLTLNLALSGGGSNQTVELHRLNADWGEGTAGSSTATVQNGGNGFAAAPGDATWNERLFGASAWSNPGATGDFNPTASASAGVGPAGINPTPYNWLSTPALVSDVQSWLDTPAANFGWALVNANETSAGTVRAFFSRSATLDAGGNPLDPGARPALTINYTIVPEPAGAALLVLAGLLLYVGWRRQ